MSLNRPQSGLFERSEITIQRCNQIFTFDWNDYRTIKSSETELPRIISFLEKTTPTLESLSMDERRDLAQLSYKVGTFYNHIKRNPDLALIQLTVAEKILTNDELAWTLNHLAFTYQQKLIAAKRQNKKEEMETYAAKATAYCDSVKNTHHANELSQIKIIGFTHCVQALIDYEMGSLDSAVRNYRLALDLYEKNDLLDTQYARAKNRWAMMLTENNQIQLAQDAFAELETYWSQKSDNFNPYPARFYVFHGDFLAKNNLAAPDTILGKYKNAIKLLNAIDEENTEFTKDVEKKIQVIEEKLQNEETKRPALF